jgi:hypothetical protein
VALRACMFNVMESRNDESKESRASTDKVKCPLLTGSVGVSMPDARGQDDLQTCWTSIENVLSSGTPKPYLNAAALRRPRKLRGV